MKWCLLLAFQTYWILVLGEFWTATVRKGVRCTDIFHNSINITGLKCFRSCLETSKCCSVNYVEEQNLCEYCTAGPTVRMMKDVNYQYIGYTINKKNRGNADHINQNPCYACAEYFDNMEVNTTDNGKVKTFRCKNNTKSDTDITEARCDIEKNKWFPTDFTCQKTCYDNKEEYDEPVSILTNGGKCLRWDDSNASLNILKDSYFTVDGKSKAAANNYCRHPTLKGIHKYYRSAPYLFCEHEDPLIDHGMCAIRSCKSTNLDQCGTPPSLPSPAVHAYPVVGDVYLTNYKCPSLSGDIPTPHCPVSRCIGEHNWTTPSISCTSKDCYPAGNHISYAGKRSCTESGRTCQVWTFNNPHVTIDLPENHKSQSNYCRGTSTRKPWCYTTDPDVRWETCNVLEC